MSDNRKAVIEMHGIRKSFYVGEPNELEILHGVDLTVRTGEFVSIVGASGSGKSTLMNIIGVLDRATAGSYLLDGEPVEDADDDELSAIRNRKIGFVFQTFNLIPRTNAQLNVELPMMYAGVGRKERSARARELLDSMPAREHIPAAPVKDGGCEGAISFQDISAASVAEKIRETDLNALTPFEAMAMLYEFKKTLGG